MCHNMQPRSGFRVSGLGSGDLPVLYACYSALKPIFYVDGLGFRVEGDGAQDLQSFWVWN